MIEPSSEEIVIFEDIFEQGDSRYFDPYLKNPHDAL